MPSSAPVVLLHAFPLGPVMWQSQVAALSGRKVLTPSFPGFGGRPPGGGGRDRGTAADDRGGETMTRAPLMTRTVTTTGTDPQGRTVNNTAVSVKQ